MFQSLTQEEVRQVVELQLKTIQKMLDKTNIKLEVTKKAVDFIAKIGFDPQFGARPIKRVIQKNLLNALSRIILEEKVDKKSLIVVDEKKGELVFTNKK
jgi:ATP-dependent Clp protease ATP-binding subunit ClpB